jgi:SAM-dependent methyltransferase
MAPPFPRKINLGSGKQFLPECLNIDINPHWSPDILCDLGKPDTIGKTYDTDRFGVIDLKAGDFDLIIAFDVLEHIPDLPPLMTNCLSLLKDGGEFDIKVPYELSFGAWQDPTHVRAFNERSWVYYTDWHWYLGWTESRFDLVNLEMEPSPLGNELLGQGHPMDVVSRVPRAIDAMRVLMRKRALSRDESEEALRYSRRDK